jgi:uncharacterized protein YaaN involved in tellurite resistance
MVLDEIMNSRGEGRKQLERDNITLTHDQASLSDTNDHLEKAVKLGVRVETNLSAEIEREQEIDRVRFLQEELLFPLRQRIQDLQQSVVVNSQGVIAIELIKRTNKELIRGVDRAINTTLSALKTAVLVATSSAGKKIVMKNLDKVNQATESMIGNTVSQLQRNVSEMNRLSSNTGLDIETLKNSFSDIDLALEDISNFRQQAIPMMAETILALDNLTDKQAKRVRELERGVQGADSLNMNLS